MSPFWTFFLLLSLALLSEASGPTIFEDGWSPVRSSQVVQLPKELPHRSDPVEYDYADDRADFQLSQEELETKDTQVDRIDVVSERVSSVSSQQTANNYIVEPAKVPQVYQEEEEIETAAPPVHHEQIPNSDDTPVIVYPSGTIPQDFGTQTAEEEAPYPPPQNEGPPPQGIRPRPPYPAPQGQPPVQRRPPPPPGWRRPPPPPQPQPYAQETGYPPENQGYPPAARQNLPRPRPRPESNGGVLSSITSGISNIGSTIKCKTEDVAIDAKLQDSTFIQKQLDCILDKGPCDELGANIRRLAPDIMKGLCPYPCDECKRNQIQKIMSTISKKYPRQWNEMVREFGRRIHQRQR